MAFFLSNAAPFEYAVIKVLGLFFVHFALVQDFCAASCGSLLGMDANKQAEKATKPHLQNGV